jgi:hypothetical protein
LHGINVLIATISVSNANAHANGSVELDQETGPINQFTLHSKA